MAKDAWIIGSGLAGATCAYEFRRHKIPCHVFEKDGTWGGLTRTRKLRGVIYEPHGSHIVHTEDEEVWNLINTIGPYNDYEHRVQTMIRGEALTWPIQAQEVERLYRKPAYELVGAGNTELLAKSIPDFETWCLQIMAPEVYADFIKPYTEKQWGRPASELAADFAPKRVQVRTDGDDRLFKDRFQGFPDATKGHSYEVQLSAMLAKAQVHLNTKMTLKRLMLLLEETPEAWRPEWVVITSPLDDFAGNVYGELEWRGLDFSAKWVPDAFVQHRMVVNWPGKEFAWIRTHETKHASRQVCMGSVLVTEFTGGEGRYYPVPGKGGVGRELNEKYQDFVQNTVDFRGPKVAFCGRLANFVYADQDDVIRDGLDTVRRLVA